jgi:hypothetical protein
MLVKYQKKYIKFNKEKNFGQSIKLFLNILSCYNTSSYIGENRGDIVTKYDKKYQIL